MAQKSLSKAKELKNDEFYTQYEDIQNELNNYTKHFKGKVVYCNCDDPVESQFCYFFLKNFNYLGLKRLICTCYKGSPVAFTIMDWLKCEDGEVPDIKSKGYVLDIKEIKAKNQTGITDEEIEKLLKNKKNGMKELEGDGDFRSDECIEYLKQSDIVCTNPPFSLFREYIAQLMKYKKKFITIGNLNAITYKEIFPLLKNNQVWLGATCFHGGATYFIGKKELYDPQKMSNPKHAFIKDNKLYWRVNGVRWFTNLDFKQRHEDIPLFKKYSKENYKKYENYNAIDVSKVSDIPRDYKGEMGVPVSIMDKYNPDQFEIVGVGTGKLGQELGIKPIPKEIDKSLPGHSSVWRLYIMDKGKAIVPFNRIIIKNKKL